MNTKIIGNTSIFNQIRAKILMSGPLTVADYMRLALFQNVPVPTSNSTTTSSASSATGQDSGYYMGKDVFGVSGDFITSPEISQMFGEMVGIWGFQTWVKIGGPKKFNIVEMGPGRGTMAKDILRVFRTFLPQPAEISLHLIEISPYLANMQFETLCGKINHSQPNLNHAGSAGTEIRKSKPLIDPNNFIENKSYYHQATTSDTGVPVFWYRSLSNLPHDFHFFIAHEFFDVLPIHKLQKVENVWREVLVDLHPEFESSPNGKKEIVEQLRYVISRHETPTIKILQNLYSSILEDKRNHLEVSLEALQIYEDLCFRLESDGGLSLLIDYGHEGTKEDTFRGFYRHKIVDPLLRPGQADLTADVDFSLIHKICQDKALLLGPISQRDFLGRTGMGTRARRLFRNCQSREEKRQLFSAYTILRTEMGDKFHCLAMLPKIMEAYRPKLKILAFDNELIPTKQTNH